LIGIIDYGAGNLRSVEKSLNFLGYEAFTSSDKEKLKNADALILPGVGAFAEAMKKLEISNLIQLTIDYAKSGKPFLGICLGMQLLFDCSNEGGNYRGLGILPGEIKMIPADMKLKVPHMGWNRLEYDKDNILFKGLSKGPYVYFVHSYYLDALEKKDVIAITDYGFKIEVAVNRDNIFATQFHPEKSGNVGLKILDNFAELANKNK
jgi:glutamine amidotransferase